MPRAIPDSPIISRAERNGYEPWLIWGYETEADWIANQEDDEWEEDEDGDVFYGSETDSF